MPPNRIRTMVMAPVAIGTARVCMVTPLESGAFTQATWEPVWSINLKVAIAPFNLTA